MATVTNAITEDWDRSVPSVGVSTARITDELQSYMDNYSQALADQYAADQANLEQQRSNDYASIMSNANVAGAMYSNLPARDKLKYDVSTYDPGLFQARESYQTGLDTMRSNVANLANEIKSMEEQGADTVYNIRNLQRNLKQQNEMYNQQVAAKNEATKAAVRQIAIQQLQGNKYIYIPEQYRTALAEYKKTTEYKNYAKQMKDLGYETSVLQTSQKAL